MTNQFSEVLENVEKRAVSAELKQYELIILDYEMPIGNGSDVCEQIRIKLHGKGIERKQ